MSAPRKIFLGEHLLCATQRQTAMPRPVKQRRSAENACLAAASNQPTRNWPVTEDWPKSFPRNYLRTSGKGVLYGHSERSGVLYGNHIYVVSPRS